MVHQDQQFVPHLLHVPWPWGLRAAEAEDIGRHDAAAILEELHLRLPHRMIQRKSMDEQKDGSMALVDVVQHRWSLPAVGAARFSRHERKNRAVRHRASV